MARKRSIWLVGCGAGCGLLVLIGIASLVGGAAWLSGMMSAFDTAIETRERLETAHGHPQDFVPWADGSIPADRLETFLAARAAMGPARQRLADLFGRLPDDPEELERMEDAPLSEKLGTVFKISRAAFGLGAAGGGFFAARNQALLEAGMGMGEYTYLYITVYDSWLQLSPAASMFGSPGATRVRVVDEEGVETIRRGPLSKRLRDELRLMLSRQLAAARELPPEGLPPGWTASLEAEVAALEADPLRHPWADGLPEPVQASLEPRRSDLEASFDAASDPFELLRNRRRGRFSIQAE